jgi:lipid-binding SYLF domain-containing protein
MKILASILLVCLSLVSSLWADKGEDEKERVKEAGETMKEILASGKGIPSKLLGSAACVVVIPNMKKAGFIVGASYGRGVMTCRTGADYKGPWSSPIMMATSSGSVGLQAGAQSTDYIILVMNDRGAQSLLKSKVKLGVDASIAAGPVGRGSEYATSPRLAQMLSYSRSEGAFGGVSLSGATLRVDDDADKNLYGETISGEEILQGKGITMPESAKPLVDALTEADQKAAAEKAAEKK